MVHWLTWRMCCPRRAVCAACRARAASHVAKPSDTIIMLHVVNTDRDAGRPAGTPRDTSEAAVVGTKEITKFYSDRRDKMRQAKPGVKVEFVKVDPGKQSIKQVILDYIEHDDVLADLLILGSVELSNTATPGTFGSIAAAVAKNSPCSVMVVKEAC